MTITHERRVLTTNKLITRTRSIEYMPKIVVLCGSTRFHEQFQRVNYEETMIGNIVLSVGCYKQQFTPEQKIALDELHKRKIDLADEVVVLNIGGYIGESTRSEIEYAQALGMPIRYIEPL